MEKFVSILSNFPTLSVKLFKKKSYYNNIIFPKTPGHGISQIGVNSEFVGDCFQLQIDTFLALQWVFTAAWQRMWSQMKKYSAHDHHNEETCQPV